MNWQDIKLLVELHQFGEPIFLTNYLMANIKHVNEIYKWAPLCSVPFLVGPTSGPHSVMGPGGLKDITALCVVIEALNSIWMDAKPHDS